MQKSMLIQILLFIFTLSTLYITVISTYAATTTITEHFTTTLTTTKTVTYDTTQTAYITQIVTSESVIPVEQVITTKTTSTTTYTMIKEIPRFSTTTYIQPYDCSMGTMELICKHSTIVKLVWAPTLTITVTRTSHQLYDRRMTVTSSSTSYFLIPTIVDTQARVNNMEKLEMETITLTMTRTYTSQYEEEMSSQSEEVSSQSQEELPDTTVITEQSLITVTETPPLLTGLTDYSDYLIIGLIGIIVVIALAAVYRMRGKEVQSSQIRGPSPMKYCINCGGAIPVSAKHCRECGTKQ